MPRGARTFILSLMLVATAYPVAARAKDLCEAYRNTAPLPEWYAEYCRGGSGGLAKVGGAFSSFADSFNLNPASIPTSPIPYGVEYISSFDPSATSAFRNNFAFIKGFSRIGAGISTNSDDTFYGNSLNTRFVGTDYSNVLSGLVGTGAVSPTFNLGTAVSLAPPNAPAGSIEPTLGGMLRYSKYSGQLSPGFGLALSNGQLTFGASWVRETASEYLPPTTFFTATAGFKYEWLQFEYVYLQNTLGYTDSDPIQILTVSGNSHGALITGAVRRLVNIELTTVYQGHFAAQYQFSRHFAAGYLYNYIPGCHSIGVQVFL